MNPGGMKIRNQLILIVVITTFITNAFLFAYDFKVEALLKDKTKIYEENTLESIRKEIDSVGEDAWNVANILAYNSQIQRYLTSQDPLIRTELNRYLREIMHYLKRANQDILFIKITDNSGYSDSASRISSIDRKFVQQYSKRRNNLKSAEFSPLIINDYPTDRENRFCYAFLFPIYDIQKEFKARHRIGTCTIFITADYIQKIMGKANRSGQPNFFVVDQTNTIVASNYGDRDKDAAGTEFVLKKAGSKEKGSNIRQFHGKSYYWKEVSLENMGWRVVNLTSTKYISDDLLILRRFRFVLLGIMLLSMTLVNSVMIRQVTRPINTIIAFIKDSRGGYKGRRIQVIKHREMGELAGYINNMLDVTDEMNERIVESQASLYEMKLAKKQSDLYALQSQINPHFLYNTLECIRSIAIVYGIQEIVSITVSMADILKYSIKASDVVKVSDEVKCIQEYINIMNIRYQGKFRTSVEIDDRILSSQLPKMTLQPIVENAIYHGLEPKLGNGELKIKGVPGNDKNRKCIRFEITDNGVGMDPVLLDHVNAALKEHKKDQEGEAGTSRKSIGLSNIERKVRILSNNKYGLHIESEAGKGTRVTVDIASL